MVYMTLADVLADKIDLAKEQFLDAEPLEAAASLRAAAVLLEMNEPLFLELMRARAGKRAKPAKPKTAHRSGQKIITAIVFLNRGMLRSCATSLREVASELDREADALDAAGRLAP